MKRLSLATLLLALLAQARAAEIDKPGLNGGLALPSANAASVAGQAAGLTVPSAARIPGLPALPAAVSATAAPQAPATPQAQAAAPKISANGGNLQAAAAQPAAQAASGAPQASSLDQVKAIRDRLEGQLRYMEAVTGPDPIFDHVRREGGAALAAIEKHAEEGRLDPSLGIRTHDGHDHPAAERPVRVGIYPVAADPFQWAHMLVGLQAMAEFSLDKIIYVLAGDDPRKPNMTPVLHRHPMGQAVLDVFAPLFAYSPIAVGTTHDGETNIFRMLGLNHDRAVEAFYLVGGDHYQRQYPNGSPDTIEKLETKLASPDSGHHPEQHAVKAAFIARGSVVPGSVPTTLDVRFLPEVPFEASSTQVRKGQLALMPYAAYEWVLNHLPGHYGIGKKP